MKLRHAKLAGVSVLAGVAFCYILHEPFLERAGKFLVNDGPGEAVPAVDVIVVLDGQMQRHREGVRLLKEGAAPEILFTMRRPSPERYALHGVPEGRGLVPVQASDNTYEEAMAVRETLAGYNATSVLLVTSDYHTRRAFRIFRRVLGPDIRVLVYPVESGHLGAGRKWWRYGASRRVIVGEYLKLVYYWIRYPGGGPTGDGEPWVGDWTRAAYRTFLGLIGSRDDVPPGHDGKHGSDKNGEVK